MHFCQTATAPGFNIHSNTVSQSREVVI